MNDCYSIGEHPIVAPAPLEYRYALDAAMSVLAGKTAPFVRCNVPALLDEVHQRIPHRTETRVAPTALWVEPLVGTWAAELELLAGVQPRGASLAIVASRPLARLLPERRSWAGRPLGLRPGGLGQLRHALLWAGFALEKIYGIHTVFAIGLNLLSRQCERWGRPDLGDQLHFAARLRYCASGSLAALSTVALLIARKEGD